ncbi:imidazole-4-carboxamide isomerase [Pseudomonas syringae pv. aceris]|uniref:Imidazole-4-carboxamide isomerase n=4 Tax=Pseudomonas TaxID=286 RepID=A0A3M5LIQ5_PSESX|nr:imidazole-4-carboxamide isomerase [Pseudomonas syringae pv. aceris]RMT47630.1 imidazole-4-carboxamide isomerase [Pseudomonas syringae pv. solidagae]
MTRCGMTFRIRRVSTSCTVSISMPPISVRWSGVATTASTSPLRWPTVRASPCNSTLKRAIPTACSCCRTSPPGMVAGKRMSKAKGKPPILTLSPEHEQQAIDKLKRLFAERFELELGSFEVAEVLELFTREIAPHYYNRAIFDVQQQLKERFESIESDVWALEKN